MKKEYKIKVIIEDIKIDQHEFNFNYKVFLDQKLIRDDYYEKKHNWKHNYRAYKKLLHDFLALDLAIMRTFEDH